MHELKNLAAAGSLLPDVLIWPEDGGPGQARQARALIDFSSLEASALPAPDWLGDVPQEKGPRAIDTAGPASLDCGLDSTKVEECQQVGTADNLNLALEQGRRRRGRPTKARRPPRVFEIGFRLGKYELLAHLARGGMGQVYKAVHLELGRTVALKVLRIDPARDSKALERFRHEARHCACLVHPNIVTLYEFDHDAEKDLYYLALEFIDGIDLEEHIDQRGRLEPELVRRILIQVGRALRHAFERGIVHRDIKPANIMLARIGHSVTVKLTDFGLARLQDDNDSKVTLEGNTVGTIDYMAPEQAQDSQSADTRSDIYSLGCTAYHMLAGQAPFSGGGVGERVWKHITAEPPDVRRFNPTVSAAFWEILRKMLAKNPADRFATPNDFLTALKRTRSTEPRICKSQTVRAIPEPPSPTT